MKYRKGDIIINVNELGPRYNQIGKITFVNERTCRVCYNYRDNCSYGLNRLDKFIKPYMNRNGANT